MTGVSRGIELRLLHEIFHLVPENQLIPGK